MRMLPTASHWGSSAMVQRVIRSNRVKSVPATPLYASLDVFLLDGKVKRLSNHTILFYKRHLTRFFRWSEEHGVTTVEAISPAILRTYLALLQDRGLTDTSLHAAARALRSWLNFCVNEEFVATSAMEKIRMPRLDRRILPSFTKEDVKRLLDTCATSRERALVVVLLDTGVRISECAALTVGDIEIKTGTVRIRQGKGGKDRVVYLGNRALRTLSRYFMDYGIQTSSEKDPVWIVDSGEGRLTDSGLRQILSRLGRRAGVQHCHPHTFRRTFALWSLRAGMSLFHLQRLMGHADIAILRQYLALVDDDLHAAHQQYGAVDHLLP
jgi:integrase/recombinase XerC